MNLNVLRLGRTEYGKCWDLQKHVFALRASGDIDDTLLLTEHNHTYTIGKSGDDNHLLAREAELLAAGVTVFHNDRGGDITYHGPGQIVGYPILNLQNHYLDLHRYLRDLEEVVIGTLKDFDVVATRKPEYTGVWVDNEKICAIGVKTSKWITMHGFALNVNTDLSYFGRIIPCGIFEHGVTSLQAVLQREVEIGEVMQCLVDHFARVFGFNVSTLGESEMQPDALSSLLVRNS